MPRHLFGFVVLGALALSACQGGLGDDGDALPPDSTLAAAPLNGLTPELTATAALDALARLPASDDSVTGAYEREDYGDRWADVDGNGCNQRDDVLLRDGVPGTVTTAPQHECDHDVLAGTWDDPYTGRRLVFDDLKDQAQAQAIPIDHLVPLAEAHRSGADRFDEETRVAFANDLGNLLAVDGPANADKADSDPAQWLPDWAGSHCAYGIVWVQVKASWGLGVDDAERGALMSLLEGCGG